MFASSARQVFRRSWSRNSKFPLVSSLSWKYKSSSAIEDTYSHDEDSGALGDSRDSRRPLNILESTEGYLSEILNARVYEAAI